jgi:hypothetical protein
MRRQVQMEQHISDRIKAWRDLNWEPAQKSRSIDARIRHCCRIDDQLNSTGRLPGGPSSAPARCPDTHRDPSMTCSLFTYRNDGIVRKHAYPSAHRGRDFTIAFPVGERYVNAHNRTGPCAPSAGASSEESANTAISRTSDQQFFAVGLSRLDGPGTSPLRAASRRR